MRSNLKVLVIVGPTAAGKSEVAAKTAALAGGEIVSADSMQIYRNMDIGTGKPPAGILALAPHHLIGFVDPSHDYSVAQFQAAARKAVDEIRERRRLPIIAGGSGLYVRSVIDPLDFPAGEPDSPLRSELTALAKENPEALIEKLRELDPRAAAGVDTKNLRRVITSIEAAVRGADSYDDRRARWQSHRSVCEALIIGLSVPRDRLTALINKRVDDMIESGLEDEVRRLTSDSAGLSTTAAQALGYKEFAQVFAGQIERVEAIELIKIRTRQFAKRQMTWFKADPRVVWLEAGERSGESLAQEIVELVKAKQFIVS